MCLQCTFNDYYKAEKVKRKDRVRLGTVVGKRQLLEGVMTGSHTSTGRVDCCRTRG